MRAEPGPVGAGGGGPGEVLLLRGFRLFWIAATLRVLGGSIAGVAFQLLIVTVIAATPFQIGC